MVEVVGTAPTSAMVITKFVYRRSWQANTINIKAITRDSIKIMKLTKEQSQEIKDQQSQQNPTKRVTAPELEKILYEAMPALDHGFVRVIARESDHVILGIQAVGSHVAELSGEFVLALEMGAVLEDIAATVHAHPTMTESFHESVLKTLGHAIHIS